MVGILIDTGATTHVAGARWATRLSLLPGVGISARNVGGGVSASLGRGTLELDLRVGASPTPSALDAALTGPRYPDMPIPGRHVRLPAADVGAFCGASIDLDDDPVLSDHGDSLTSLVCCATGVSKPAASSMPPAEFLAAHAASRP